MNRTRRILSTLGLAALLGTTLPACVVTARGRIATGAVVADDGWVLIWVVWKFQP